MKRPRTGTTPTHGSSATSETAPTPAAASFDGATSGPEPEPVTIAVTTRPEPHVYADPPVPGDIIPTFLVREPCATNDTKARAKPASASGPTSTTPPTPSSAAAPAAVGSTGSSLGSSSAPGLTGDFLQFRVDPDEIESKIKHEADRRWRMWVPTKDHLTRPRKSWYVKQVRKEFF